MDRIARNKELVRRFVEAGNSRNHEALEEIVATDFRRHCPSTPDLEVRSLADFQAFLEQDEATFPDNRVTMRKLVAEGDQVAFWADYEGTQEGAMGPFPATGRKMRCEFAGVFTIAEDRIVELRLVWDNVSVLAQLGHLPSMG